MKTPELLSLLQEFHRDKLAMLMRHQAGARVVGRYDVNNTYQYIINREEAQLEWLASAIAELGGTPATGPAEPERHATGKGPASADLLLEEDGHDCAAFVERWRPRVEALDHARHRGMLRVILGETLEQKRFFDQALAGRDDLLGRRSKAVGPRVGSVLSTRWVE